MSFPRASSAWVLAALVAGFALLCLPLLLTERESNYTFDETSYHLPAVRQIATRWPKLDVRVDSLSATAPGYHYVLAGLSRLVGSERRTLRIANLAVSAGALILLWRARPANLAHGVTLCALLPLAASNFFVKSASYLVTDNAALLAVCASLVAVFFAPSGAGVVSGSVAAAAAVFVRQSSLWLAAPVAVRAWRKSPRALWLLLTLPPVAVLAWLAMTWGGLVPPAWRDFTRPAGGFVPAAGAYLLSVLAILGPAYYACARPAGWVADLRCRWTVAGAAAGLGITLAGPNLPDHGAGRWGGYLWDLAARMPSAGSWSPVFLLLAPAGGALAAMLLRRLRIEAGGSAAFLWLAALGAWAATALSNRQVFHRYYEPTLLVLLICWLFLIARTRPAGSPLRAGPLAILAGVQLLLTLATAHGRTFGYL